MKVIAVNGGPRKQWNTATLLHKAQMRQERFPQDCRQAFDLGARLSGRNAE